MPKTTRTKKIKITAQEAARKAIDYYQEVANDHSQPNVEEIEISDDKKHWLITLGIVKSAHDAVSAMYGKVETTYKVFKIDSQSGDVLSMKIRETKN